MLRSRDARAILERSIKLQEEGIIDSDPNVYRGQAAYRSFVKKDPAQVGMNKFTGLENKFILTCLLKFFIFGSYLRTQGPIRAPSFVRSSARFDYQVRKLKALTSKYTPNIFFSLTSARITKKQDFVDTAVSIFLRLIYLQFVIALFSDQCKFLHDRGDYKSGWQLEKEWDQLQSQKKRKMEEALNKFYAEGTEGQYYLIINLLYLAITFFDQKIPG